MRDSRTLTDQVEFFDPPTAEQVAKARLTVCAQAADTVEATELLKMLGLYPGQEEEFMSSTNVPVHPDRMMF